MVLREKHEAVRTVRAIDGIVSGAARAVLRHNMEFSEFTDDSLGRIESSVNDLARI